MVEGVWVEVGVVKGVAVAVGVSEGGSLGIAVKGGDVGESVGVAVGENEHALRATAAIARMTPIRMEPRFMRSPL